MVRVVKELHCGSEFGKENLYLRISGKYPNGVDFCVTF